MTASLLKLEIAMGVATCAVFSVEVSVDNSIPIGFIGFTGATIILPSSWCAKPSTSQNEVVNPMDVLDENPGPQSGDTTENSVLRR